jgi:hypothetical protein
MTNAVIFIAALKAVAMIAVFSACASAEFALVASGGS